MVMRKTIVLACVAAVIGGAAGVIAQGQGLEMSSGRNDAAIDAHLSQQKIEAINQSFSSALNAITTAMRTCGNADKFYAPGSTGADSNGCKAAASSGMPAGSVVAFRLSACPAGWNELTTSRGRVIIGMGTLGSDSYALNATGGASMRTLTAANVPVHTHPITSVGLRMLRDGSGKHGWFQGLKNESAYQSSSRPDLKTKANTGGGQPFDNRPPYLALLYCIKN